MKFLVETTDDVKIIESVDHRTNRKRLFLEGITLQAEVINANNRIYPINVLKEAVTNYCSQHLSDNRAVGELDHPMANIHKINPDRISHKFVKVKQEGNNFITKALILDTTCGKQVKNLIEGGVKIGMSQRGFGKTKNKNGVSLVEQLLLVTLVDIVIDPSAPQAFSQAVYENKDWVVENGVLVGKDVEPIIDKTKRALKLPRGQREKMVWQFFNEYLETINANARSNHKIAGFAEILNRRYP